ncbi:type IA DNA topoisomerase [Flavobacterium psychrotrophum]|uniref:type IA DNA topoisomerase n=1 Tax=Flavobacterium psychrotrophum TaxID=2294119 RepID=UPI000E30D21F|nr:type IA DNA topoisomerase [Flavobacterium psychrotrophum]
MIAVLAEKPIVARELAALLGATDKKEGYSEGNGYAVTWAFGHLVSLALPEAYGYTGFQKYNLPILPDTFTLAPRLEANRKKDKSNSIIKQLEVIENLFQQCKNIIVATDAGREGELIFRYIYDYLKCTKPFQRLWVSSLTETALKKGFENLQPGTDFDNLYQAAHARSRADWLVGINATQALTIAAGTGIYPLGRVQTPTLAMICRRYEERQNFIPEKFWQLQLQHTKSFLDFHSISTEVYHDKIEAEEAYRMLQRQKQAVVTAIHSEIVKDPPPLLFDLTGLQKEANRKLGFTASETLDIAQSLYEKKFITYPRTGSKYITPDLWSTVPELIRGLEADPAFSKVLPQLKYARLNKHIVNEGKVTDHHGLLVTEKVPSALSVKEATIYHMIAFRLLEAVSETCVREVTAIELQVLQYRFKATSVTVMDAGWCAIQGKFEHLDDAEMELPEIKVDDVIVVSGASLLEKQKRGPALYTEASLLTAMEHPESGAVAPDIKQKVKAGLGTPATRAGIIEGLLTRQYIQRKGKSLTPTEKGIAVYNIVAEQAIASVTMTADWESALEGIENGESTADDFENEIKAYTEKITNELLQTKISREAVPELLCPRCNASHLIIDEKAIRCPDKSCNWSQWRTVCSRNLSLDEIEKLIQQKSTPVLKGLKSKAGKAFNARLVLNEQSEVVFGFEK